MSYQLNDRQTIGLGYGYHSQMQPLVAYFTRTPLPDGTSVESNRNAKNVTHEFGLDLQDITNHQNEFRRTYNPRTNSVETQYQIGFFPVPQYRILF